MPAWRAVGRQAGRARAEQVRLLETLVFGELPELVSESSEIQEHAAPGQWGSRADHAADLAGAGDAVELDELTELAE
jgi:hypothetical protein